MGETFYSVREIQASDAEREVSRDFTNLVTSDATCFDKVISSLGNC